MGKEIEKCQNDRGIYGVHMGPGEIKAVLIVGGGPGGEGGNTLSQYL
jgi:hypothetical protein